MLSVFLAACFSLASPQTDSIAIVANGEIEKSLKEEIGKHEQVIAIDGGLNYCHEMGIKPTLIFGDFDSINEKFLPLYRDVNQVVLDRAKDLSDLEAALAILSVSKPCLTLYAGLGQRIDHTLVNLYILRRYRDSLVIKTEHETLFAIGPNQGKRTIKAQKGAQLSLLSLVEPVEGIRMEGAQHLPKQLNPENPIFSTTCTDDEISLQVSEGIAIVILHDHPIHPMPTNLEALKLHYDFGLEHSIIEHVHLFNNLRKAETPIVIENDEYQVMIAKNNNEIKLETIPGQVISLIPLFGPAEGIETRGLKWKLSSTTLSHLDEHFVSLSNVAKSKNVTISVQKGYLVCIVNKKLIDTEMLLTQDRTKTKDLIQ